MDTQSYYAGYSQGYMDHLTGLPNASGDAAVQSQSVSAMAPPPNFRPFPGRPGFHDGRGGFSGNDLAQFLLWQELLRRNGSIPPAFLLPFFW